MNTNIENFMEFMGMMEMITGIREENKENNNTCGKGKCESCQFKTHMACANNMEVKDYLII